jgi:hypothetical protein
MWKAEIGEWQSQPGLAKSARCYLKNNWSKKGWGCGSGQSSCPVIMRPRVQTLALSKERGEGRREGGKNIAQVVSRGASERCESPSRLWNLPDSSGTTGLSLQVSMSPCSHAVARSSVSAVLDPHPRIKMASLAQWTPKLQVSLDEVAQACNPSRGWRISSWRPAWATQ